jgi:hypothetical protein
MKMKAQEIHNGQWIAENNVYQPKDTKPMSKELTPTAGLQVEDIKRVGELIRALYWGQKVWQYYAYGDKTFRINGHHVEYSGSWLLLRPLSSITDDEAVQMALIMGLTSGDFTIERTDEDGQPLLCLNAEEESQCLSIFFEGDIYFHDLDSMDAVPGLNYLHAYTYLQQKGFALPFYDSVTNTTITVEQMVSAGIIKLKS